MELLDRLGKVVDVCEQLENETAEAQRRIASHVPQTSQEVLNEYGLSVLKTLGLYEEHDVHGNVRFRLYCLDDVPFSANCPQ